MTFNNSNNSDNIEFYGTYIGTTLFYINSFIIQCRIYYVHLPSFGARGAYNMGHPEGGAYNKWDAKGRGGGVNKE